jgi:hypothetical protein
MQKKKEKEIWPRWAAVPKSGPIPIFLLPGPNLHRARYLPLLHGAPSLAARPRSRSTTRRRPDGPTRQSLARARHLTGSQDHTTATRCVRIIPPCTDYRPRVVRVFLFRRGEAVVTVSEQCGASSWELVSAGDKSTPVTSHLHLQVNIVGAAAINHHHCRPISFVVRFQTT